MFLLILLQLLLFQNCLRQDNILTNRRWDFRNAGNEDKIVETPTNIEEINYVHTPNTSTTSIKSSSPVFQLMELDIKRLNQR